jgi:ubiquitin C-terminal hydrolase
MACHVGSFSRGHYYAICKNNGDGIWYHIDDTRIYKIPKWESPVNFYMGFYELIGSGDSGGGGNNSSI